MPRNRRLELELPMMLRHLTAVGENAPPMAEKVSLLRSMRGADEQSDKMIDDMLVRHLSSLVSSLRDAENAQQKLNAMVEKLTAPPWHAAVFLARTTTRRGEAVVVHTGNSRRVVTADDGVELDDLKPGDEVLLSPERNVVVDASFNCIPRGGDSAFFDRMTPDGQRMVLRYRDEEIVVTPSGSCDIETIKAGDIVLWDRDLRMAFERIESSKGDHLFLEETPEQSFADIGGLDRTIEELKRWIWIHRDHAETAMKYDLQRRRGVILVGPPGNGKTMLARAFARYLADLSPSGRCRFMNIKPSALHSMWYAQSEANYRETFRVAREAGESDPDIPVVMFFDEIDAIGSARGSSLGRVDDRVLPSFMAELDGLETNGRNNIIVLAASNRADALDPALLRPNRLGDALIHIPRPNRKAAGEIFSKYLHDDIPLNGEANGREEPPHELLIDSVLSRIFSSNGEGLLATMKFRDGSERAVKATDLISGAIISKIVNDAVERACLREIETEEIGVRLGDLLTAVDIEFDRIMRFLTPRNCAKHIDDLPQDMDVVSIRPNERKVRRPHLYLRVS